MDFKSAIDLIIRELDEAREIMDSLKKTPGISILEIELAKAKCRSAAELIAMLKEMEKVTPPPHTPSPPLPPVPPQTKELPKKPVVTEPDTFELTSDEEHKDPEKPEIVHPEQKPFVAPIIADTFSHLANSFNEQIGESKEEDFSYTHGRNYTNLSDAIGVNDRFYYVRELFDGNRDKYNEALVRLEKAESLDDARDIIKSYGKDMKDNAAAKQLLNLVKRKFTPHE